MKNFQPLVLNSNEAREPFSGGASEAGVTTSRSSIKNLDSSYQRKSVGKFIPTTGVNNTRSNIKN